MKNNEHYSKILIYNHLLQIIKDMGRMWIMDEHDNEYLFIHEQFYQELDKLKPVEKLCVMQHILLDHDTRYKLYCMARNRAEAEKLNEALNTIFTYGSQIVRWPFETVIFIKLS